MSAKYFALALAALVSVAACGDDDGGGSGNTGPTVPGVYDFSAFENEIEAFRVEQGLEGVGAILVHRDDGVIYQHSFGRFTDDRVYLLASASKMISAGVVMRLADQGLLDIDAPVIDAVGWGPDNPTITPAQLISNSSGLVGLLPNPTYLPYICQYIPVGTLQNCARTIFTSKDDDDAVIPPDTEFRYGGAQWQVAGGVAEIVSGRSWAELIDETYVQPCGLGTLAYNNHFAQQLGEPGELFLYPHGFDGDPSVLLANDNPNLEAGAYTTIGDYGKLLLMHLRGGLCDNGRVLSEESVRLMHADRIGAVYNGTTVGFGESGYGLGWWVNRNFDSLISDPGAYGAFPWIDEGRDYAGFLVVEDRSATGAALFGRVYELANTAVEAAR